MKNCLLTLTTLTVSLIAAQLAAAPVLPGYLTDPSVVKSGLAADASYQSPEPFRYPYVSTYYVKPVFAPDENVKIGIFVTDFDSSKIRFLDDSHQFAAFLELRARGATDWKRFVLKKLRSGDHTFDLGRLAVGDYEMRVWALDRQLRESHRVLHDFSVREAASPSRDATYAMTKGDLAKYKIRNDGNLATVIWEGSNGVAKTIRAKNPSRPGYTVHVPTKNGKPVFQSFRRATIVYDANYSTNAVEQEAVANAEGLQKLIDEKAAAGVKRLTLLPGTYRISAARKIELPDHFTLDLNGATLKQNGFTGCHSVIVQFPSAVDAALVNGTLEGDYYEHDYKNSPNHSEWPMGFNFCGACYGCSVERVKVIDITGYGAGNGIGKDRRGDLCYACEGLGKYVAGGLDRKTGELDPNDKARFTTDFRSVAKFKKYGRLQVSKYLGYQGRATRSWQTTVCWYDAGKKFLAAETSWQYREMFIPEKAAFLRVSIEEESVEKANNCGLTMTRMRVPTNCSVVDCAFERCRCVGYAASAMKNMLFKGNFFTASGESAARCAFDAEDGWDQMQDCYFLANTFRDNPVNNSILTCCGHNFILEKNDCAIHFWGRTHSPCVRNNKVSSACYGCDSRARSGYGRFSGNTYSEKVELGRSEGKRRIDSWDFVLSGLEFDGARGDKAPTIITGNGGRLVNCVFKNMEVKVGNAYACRFENCKGDFYPAGRWFETTVTNCQFRYFYNTNVFTRCHVTDCYFQGFRNGQFTIKGGDYTRNRFQNLDICDFRVNDATFNDSVFATTYWEKNARLTFTKCTVSNAEKKPFVTSALYAIGKIFFDGCTFSGASEALHIGDSRPQPTDTQDGYVAMRGCTWKSSAPFAVTRSTDKVSPKKLHFADAQNTWPASTSLTTPTLPATWSLKSTP